jgi:predicted phage-related endonuclease
MDLRCAKLTASQFKTCFMGKSTKGFKDLIYTKRAELKTREIEDSFSNFWTERGHELEPLAREAYEIETFNEVLDAGFWEYSEFIGASPDGLVGEDGLIEIKCPKASTVERYLEQNKLPAEYYWQVHGQMMCTGRKWVDFVVYHPKYDLFTLRINRDESIIKELEEKLNEVVNLILKK